MREFDGGEVATSFDWLSSSPAALHWVESVPAEGRSVIGTWRKQRGASRGAFAVGSGLHASGGVPYVVTQLGGWAVSDADGQVWHVNSITRCTDTPGKHGDLTYGDGAILCVRETGEGDELVLISPVTGEVGVLRRADFLASPRLRAGRLAWTQRDSGVMPASSSEVWIAHYEPGGKLRTVTRVAGGPDEAALQPQWGADEALYFMSNRSGGWNLYRWRDGITEPVTSMDAESAATRGGNTYAFLPDARVAMIVQREAQQGLAFVEPGGAVTPVELPYTSIEPCLAVLGDRVALIGSAQAHPQQIALVATDGSGVIDVIKDRAA